MYYPDLQANIPINASQAIEKSIIQTLGYFDIFDYPLTLIELHRFLLHKTKTSISTILSLLPDIPLIETYQGFYFIQGRKNIIKKRLARYNTAEIKFKKALQAASLLKLIPSIKLIAVCNNLAFSNAQEKSDIDLFVVAQKNKVWQARFWTLAIATLLRQRVVLPNRIKNKIDLNFFVDEEKMNLSGVASLRYSEFLPDYYLIYWLATLVPLYEKNIWQNFIKENSWLKNYLPNWYAYQTNPKRSIGSKNKLPSPQQIYKKIQLKIMPKAVKKAGLLPDTRVIISDKILKFHLNDRRSYYNRLFKEKWVV